MRVRKIDLLAGLTGPLMPASRDRLAKTAEA
jgi:hypothetical protein